MFESLIRKWRLARFVESQARRRVQRAAGFKPRLEMFEDRTLLSITWTGGNGDWNDASHWTGGMVPGANDDAIINTAGITVTHDSAMDDPVQTLTLSANAANTSFLHLGAGSIKIALSTGTGLAVSANFTLQIAGGSLVSNSANPIGANVTTNATVSVTAGSLTAQGALTFNGGTLTVAGTGTVTGLTNFTFTNSTVNFNGGSIIGGPIYTGSSLNIGPDGTAATTFLMRGANNLSGTVHAGQTVSVAGIVFTYGSATLIVGAGTSNAGLIVLDANDSRVSATLATAGTLTNASGGVIRAYPDGGGNRFIEVARGATLFNEDRGLIEVIPSVSLTITGNLTNRGQINAAGSIPLTITGGVYDADGGSISGPGYVFNAQVHVTRSPVPALPINITGNTTLIGNNPAGTTLAVVGIVFTYGTAMLNVGDGASNAGLIQLYTNDSRVSSALATAGMLTNASGGVIRAYPDGGGNRFIEVARGATLFNEDQGVIDGNNINLPISGGTYEAAGGSMTGNAYLDGLSFRVTASPSTGQANINLRGDCTLVGDNLAHTTLSLQAIAPTPARLNVSGGAVNQGTINLIVYGNSTSATLTVTGSSPFTNAAGGAINSFYGTGGNGTFQFNGDLVNAGTVGVFSTLPFAGTFFSNESTGVVTGSGTLNTTNVLFTNDGTIRVDQGSTLTISGPITNLDPTTHQLTGGTYDISGVLNFSGANVVKNAATIILNGPTSAIHPNGMPTISALAGFNQNVVDNGFVGSFTVTGQRTFAVSASEDFENDGTLTVGEGSTFTVSVNHRYIQAANATAVIDRGTLQILGSFDNFDANSNTLNGGTYQLAGTTPEPGRIIFPGAAIGTNAATIVLDGPGARIVDPGDNDALATLANNTGALTIENGRNLTLATLANSGNLTVDTGSALQAAAFDNSANLTIGAGSTVQATAEFSNEGTATVATGGLLQITGAFDNYANNTLGYGTFILAGTLRFPSADIQTNNATLVLDGAGTHIIDDAQPTLDGLRNLATNNGSFTIQSEDPANPIVFTRALAFTDNGSLTIGPSATFRVVGNPINTYTEAGTVTVLDTGTLEIDTMLTNLDANGNLNGGVFWIAGTLKFNLADSIRVNNATLVLLGQDWSVTNLRDQPALPNLIDNAATGTLRIVNAAFDTGGAFTNDGQIIVDGSKFGVNGDYTQNSGSSTHLANGSVLDVTQFTFFNHQGAVLAGSGDIIAGMVVNAGMLLVGGETTAGFLQIEGSFTQTNTGRTVFKLGGLTQGDSFDYLHVTGAANLDGVFKIRILGNFFPSLGDTFQILCADMGLTTQTSFSFDLPNLGGLHLNPDTESDPNCLTLVTSA